jgi:hypothetical protein
MNYQHRGGSCLGKPNSTFILGNRHEAVVIQSDATTKVIVSFSCGGNFCRGSARCFFVTVRCPGLLSGSSRLLFPLSSFLFSLPLLIIGSRPAGEREESRVRNAPGRGHRTPASLKAMCPSAFVAQPCHSVCMCISRTCLIIGLVSSVHLFPCPGGIGEGNRLLAFAQCELSQASHSSLEQDIESSSLRLPLLLLSFLGGEEVMNGKNSWRMHASV